MTESDKTTAGTWMDDIGPVDQRALEFHQRLLALRMTLSELWDTRGISDPSLYPVPPETLEPGYAGPEEDGFPDFPDAAMLIPDIGKLVAAMGGHLELRAVFPNDTVELMAEPGPEQFNKPASSD